MRKVTVVDGDILTSLGDLQSTWSNLLACRSGIKMQGFAHLEERWPLGLIDIPGEYNGRWNRFERVFDSLFQSLPPLPEKTQLICATTKAAVDELLITPESEVGQPWQIGQWLNERLGCVQPPITVSAACASGTIGIIQGATRIGLGECDHVLVVAFDLVSEFILTGFDSLQALSPTGAKPFDTQRDGLSLGDGAGWILLAVEGDKACKQFPMARVEGWSMSCDAHHITAPCRKASGLIRAFRNILEETAIPVGGVVGHGTATVYNDAMELVAMKATMAQGMPLCSVKGGIGHSLGAAGLVEAMLSILSLQHRVLPPTVGLNSPEESSCTLSGSGKIPLKYQSVISSNSGFGGINAALFLTEEA